MTIAPSGIQQALLVAERNLRRLPRAPEQIGGAIAQPITFTLLFAFVFGHAIHAPGGGSYREYLLAGIMVQVMAFASTTNPAGVAEDMASGLVDRLRSLPITRSATLSGRVASDLVQRAGQLAVATALGLLIGWSPPRYWPDRRRVRAAPALRNRVQLGRRRDRPALPHVESANNVGLLWLFPITLIANTFVPINAIPAGLRTVAEWNPLSSMVAATRQLFGNPTTHSNAWPLPHPIITSTAWSILIIAAFATIAIRRYRKLSR